MRAKYSYRGQSTLEYTIMIAVVIGALLLMQIYMKRGVQAGIKDVADLIGNQQDYEDFDPLKGARSNSDIHQYTNSSTTTEKALGGGVTTYIDSSSNSSGTSTYVSESED